MAELHNKETKARTGNASTKSKLAGSQIDKSCRVSLKIVAAPS